MAVCGEAYSVPESRGAPAKHSESFIEAAGTVSFSEITVIFTRALPTGNSIRNFLI
jgi:hypothetical protein